MFCPACGVRNEPTSVRCSQCSTILAPDRSYREADLAENASMRALIPVGRSGYAIAAGYLGLISVMLVPAPLAVLFSILAIRDIQRDPKKHGMGRAVFGLIFGGLGSIALLGVLYSSMVTQ